MMLRSIYIIHFIVFSLTAFGMSAKKPPVKESSFYPCSEEVFWWAVRWAESSNNPRAVYMEAWGENSVGLYMLSASDSKRYKDCPSTEEELKDPVKNEKCAMSIAKTLRAKYPAENWSQVLGLYWSTLRARNEPKWATWRAKNPKHNGFDNFVKFANQKGCVIK
jgi:hypothetical protein